MDLLILLNSISLKFFEIIFRHKFSFYVIHCFSEGIHEFVKVLFVQEDLVFDVVSIFKTLLTLCDSDVIVVPTGGLNIKEVSSFARSNPL